MQIELAVADDSGFDLIPFNSFRPHPSVSIIISLRILDRMGRMRVANASDVDTILAFDPIAETDAPRRHFIHKSVKQGECYVYDIDGEIVGYVMLNYHFFGCGFVALLVVHSDHRRKGIGSDLIQYIESVCDPPKLFTSTNQSNKPMQALLAKLDYQRSGIIENLDEGDPELVYFKRIEP